jgi:hypothetical protein
VTVVEAQGVNLPADADPGGHLRCGVAVLPHSSTAPWAESVRTKTLPAGPGAKWDEALDVCVSLMFARNLPSCVYVRPTDSLAGLALLFAAERRRVRTSSPSNAGSSLPLARVLSRLDLFPTNICRVDSSRSSLHLARLRFRSFSLSFFSWADVLVGRVEMAVSSLVVGSSSDKVAPNSPFLQSPP